MKGRKRSRKTPPGVQQEWVLGKGNSPAFVKQRGGYHPVMVFVVEGVQIVGFTIHHPDDPLDMHAFLQDVMNKPKVGAPRYPGSCRVAEPELQAEILAAFPDMQVTLGPTPEIDQALYEFEEEYNAVEDVTYLQGGRIPEVIMKELFQASHGLYETAPWKDMREIDIVRMDMKTHEVEGLIVSVLGHSGDDYGLLVFKNYDAYQDFVEFTRNGPPDPEEVAGLENPEAMCIALSFENAVDISSTARKEAAKHQWLVANTGAYPVPTMLMKDLSSMDCSEEDISLLGMVILALDLFYKNSDKLFNVEEVDPLSAEVNLQGAKVQVTFPHDANEVYEASQAAKED